MPSLRSILTAALSLAAVVQAIPQGPGGSGSSGWSDSGSGSGSSATTELAVAATSSSSNGVGSSQTAASSAASSTSTVACNNSKDLCNRKYSNVTHMGAHGASFVRDDSTDNSIAGNQYYNATKALSAGIRLLAGQVHNENGTLRLCHTTCSLLDAGTLESWLGKIKYWMDNNPNDVVTLILVNSDDEDVSAFGSVFESSNISTYGYTPATTSSANDWPTLQTMIDDGTRLVTFLASVNYSTTYPYLLNEWDYVFETAYEITSPSQFNCSLDRPSSLSSASSALSSGYLPLMNHFLYKTISSYMLPNAEDIDQTNSNNRSLTGSLAYEAYECNDEWAQAPTFALVDFYNKGPAIDTADMINGINATGRKSETSSSSAAASLTGGVDVRMGLLMPLIAVAVSLL